MATVYFEGVEIECEEGVLLRDVLIAADRAPYNSAAEYTNCGGNGICGTCAVRVEGEASEPTKRERVRRSAPPLRGKDVRLSCQTRVEGDMTVLKPPGFWGQHAEASPEPATVGDGEPGEWPTFRRTPTNAGAADGAEGPGTLGEERWTADLPGSVRGGLCLAPTHGLVYGVTASAKVVAVDATTGEERWTAAVDFSYDTGGAPLPPSPVIDTGTVYVGSGYLKAFDATTGEERWTADIDADHVRATPALRSNTLYAPTSADSVVAVDTATGEPRWWVRLGETDEPEEGDAAETVTELTAAEPAAPTVVEDRVYVGSTNGVHAFDALSQAVDWETETPAVQSPPAVLDDWLWVGTAEGVVALGASGGTVHWEHDLADPVVAAPVVDPEASQVYAATNGGDLVALAPSTGNVVWSTSLDHRVLASPTLANGTLYVGTVSGDLVAVDTEDGERVGSQTGDGQLYASPVVQEDALYFGTGTGTVYAVEEGEEDADDDDEGYVHPAHQS